MISRLLLTKQCNFRHIPYVRSMVNYVVGPSTEAASEPSLGPPMSAVPSSYLEKEHTAYHTTNQPARGISN